MCKRALFLAFLFFNSLNVFGQQYNAEVKAEYESWASGLGGQATALLGGAGLSYYKDEYYFGGGFVAGNYSIEDDGGDDISRLDMDLVAGYQLQNNVSVFAGYRLNKMNMTSASGDAFSFNETTHGIGGGVTLYEPIKNDFYAFGTAALSLLLTKTSYKDNSSDDKGFGYSLGTEAGIMYQYNQKTTFASRLKYQTSKLDYDPAEWSHSYVRIGFDIGYSF